MCVENKSPLSAESAYEKVWDILRDSLLQMDEAGVTPDVFPMFCAEWLAVCTLSSGVAKADSEAKLLEVIRFQMFLLNEFKKGEPPFDLIHQKRTLQ